MQRYAAEVQYVLPQANRYKSHAHVSIFPEKCKAWMAKNLPDMFAKLNTAVEGESKEGEKEGEAAKEGEGKEGKRQTRGGKASKVSSTLHIGTSRLT